MFASWKGVFLVPSILFDSWPGGVMVTFLKVQKAGAMIVAIGEWGQHQGLTGIPIRT